MLTEAILATAFPTIPPARRKTVVAAALPVLDRYQINTVNRVSIFVGQCAHESALFSVMVENLNYSAAALTATWPSRFPPALAPRYARNSRAIASRAYSNRMGNGSEASGDGWTYRGRGYIQITGKDNYQAFAGSMGITLAQAITCLETPAGAMMSAGWFWSRNNLNRLADGWQVTAITTRINGGLNGAGDRLKKCNSLRRALIFAA